MLDKIAMWQWPDSDLEAWQELTGNTFTLAEYKARLARMSEGAERDGYELVLIEWSVERMAAELEKAGLENTTENRARLIAEAYDD